MDRRPAVSRPGSPILGAPPPPPPPGNGRSRMAMSGGNERAATRHNPWKGTPFPQGRAGPAVHLTERQGQPWPTKCRSKTNPTAPSRLSQTNPTTLPASFPDEPNRPAIPPRPAIPRRTQIAGPARPTRDSKTNPTASKPGRTPHPGRTQPSRPLPASRRTHDPRSGPDGPARSFIFTAESPVRTHFSRPSGESPRPGLLRDQGAPARAFARS